MSNPLSTLNPSRFEQASYRETRYRIDVERGTTLEQIQHPLFWAHVAKKLKPHDIISVVSDDNTFWAELLVLSVGKERAYVAVIQQVDINAAIDKLLSLEGAVAATDNTAPQIVWKSGKLKYCIIRGETLVQSGFATKPEAAAWLTSADQKAA